MEEILFRGMEVTTRDWVYGSYIYNPKTKEHLIASYQNGELLQLVIDKKTLGMYTNTKDKLKEKAFQGDIVEHPVFGRKVITWGSSGEEGVFSDMKAFMFDRTISFISQSSMNDTKIIGNIYQNPKLLDGN